MIPSKFKYQKAGSVADAIRLLSETDGEAKLLAGGHSLLPSMKLRLSEPDALIDISKLEELKSIRKDGNTLVIGAGCTHHAIATSSLVEGHMSMISQAGHMIGDPHVRNVGTIGGSLAHADPAADWPALMLAANAVIVVRGPGGERQINAGDFFKSLFFTALNDNEIITEIRIAAPPHGAHSAYAKFHSPASRYAIVGCAAFLQLDGLNCLSARIAFTGASSTPFRDTGVENALVGKAINEESIHEAAQLAAEGVQMMTDHFASEKYRRNLARVYAKKAIRAAAGL
ncbi:MAG: xanthine dehydrogenase family protein subunit M [Bacteroidota bacterium]